MIDINEAKKLVTYCGGFCGACGMYKGRIWAMVAQDFKEIIEVTGFAEWVPKFEKIDFNFSDFLKGLEYFANERTGPYCKFPCEHFAWILKNHPDKLEDCERFKKIGLEGWIKFNLERAEKGYASGTHKYYSQAKKE